MGIVKCDMLMVWMGAGVADSRPCQEEINNFGS